MTTTLSSELAQYREGSPVHASADLCLTTLISEAQTIGATIPQDVQKGFIMGFKACFIISNKMEAEKASKEEARA